MTALKMAWTIFFITLIAAIVTIAVLPAETQIAVHWNIEGEVDKYAGLIEGLLIQPGIMLLVLGLIQLFKFLEPRQENLQESKVAKEWIALAVVCLMAIISFSSIALAFGYTLAMVKIIMASIMLMLVVIGNFLSKTKSNFFIGIRTPWTLSNEQIWQKTHRLGGRLFVIAGIIGFPLALLLADNVLVYLVLALILPATLIPCIYSWLLWYKTTKNQ